MRSWNLPSRPRGLIFDLDSTLYEHPAYARFQTGVLVERLAAERGEALEVTQALLAKMREERRRLGEADTSLGNLSLALGVPIETSVAWREELIHPEEWLGPDARLDEALTALAGNFPLGLVTNNPRSIALSSLEALGVRRHFSCVIGLDDTGHSKPDPAPFALASRRLNLPPAALISIGDREDVDIRPALALGMGGLLISTIGEVYELPSFLSLPISRT
ncbi:MAG: HAD family hydrolase [Treponema sp.]|nr:HAD family hydrolase [Treponema sp.]